jgi:hypothetical protein
MNDQRLEFLRADDRKNEVHDQPESNDSDNEVGHKGNPWSDFFARPDEDEHESEEADSESEKKEILHNSLGRFGLTFKSGRSRP